MNKNDKELLEKKLDNKFKYLNRKIDEKFEILGKDRYESSIITLGIMYMILGFTLIASVFLSYGRFEEVIWLASFTLFGGLFLMYLSNRISKFVIKRKRGKK